mmetsp:Transcript_7587/g.10490  ORF Transcript_7587/g.10490 Transcript_7587/m.10490 type:complete len:93 (+) Transcript_7587:166-444(+)
MNMRGWVNRHTIFTTLHVVYAYNLSYEPWASSSNAGKDSVDEELFTGLGPLCKGGGVSSSVIYISLPFSAQFFSGVGFLFFDIFILESSFQK